MKVKRRVCLRSGRWIHSLLHLVEPRRLQQVRYFSSARRALLHALLAWTARTLSIPRQETSREQRKMCRFLENRSGFSGRRCPGSGGRPSHPFVGRWHRRFTGSGGGAINSRRRCLSGCLVIYSDRFIHLSWFSLTLKLFWGHVQFSNESHPKSRLQTFLSAHSRVFFLLYCSITFGFSIWSKLQDLHYWHFHPSCNTSSCNKVRVIRYDLKYFITAALAKYFSSYN